MYRIFKGCGFGLVFVAAIAAAEPPGADQEKAHGHADRVGAALKRLGSPEYADREAASTELQRIGEPALPGLREASAGPDPEVRRRAQWLLLAILRSAGKSRTTGMDLLPVLAGEFRMGAPMDERPRQLDEAQHRVRLTRSFLIGAREVTQDEYRTVTGTNPSWFAPTGEGRDKVRDRDTARYPVEQVSWFEAIEYCNRLSAGDGFPPYYKLADVIRDDTRAVTAATVTALGGNGYRLPTEAEWEYACRAWSVTPFHYGRTSTGRESNVKAMIPGGYSSPPETVQLGRTTTTGSYKANRRGLSDMHGNVAEWCWDWYDKDYSAGAPTDDPTGPAKGTHRVVRGGSWLIGHENSRSASRAFLVPAERTYTTGFRVARTP